MTGMSRARRAIVAGCALTAAFVLFHGQIATAVVTRADDALRSGDTDTAIRLYDRAAHLDPHSTVAADRLAFHLALRHDRANALASLAITSHALAAGAPEPALYADRAFAELQLHAWREAERDFDRAGRLAHDARYEHFAARMALRAGNAAAARRYARLALADDPGFAPARALLRTLE
jgi:tetratricopeptide (TPR) repeat protein